MRNVSFKARRALIPADSFYEWRKSGDRQPYLFRRADGDPLAFGGLWEVWHDPHGERVRSCTIVTVAANGDVRDVHDRMPLVLERDEWDRWLDPEVTDRDELESMLHPGTEGTIVCYPVDKRVGKVGVDDPDLILAVGS